MNMIRLRIVFLTPHTLHIRISENFTKTGLDIAIISHSDIFTYTLHDLHTLREKLISIKKILRDNRMLWLELRSIDWDLVKPYRLRRFMLHASIKIPVDLRQLIKYFKIIRSSIVIITTGDAINALYLALFSIIFGAGKILISLHAIPNYKRFIYLKPIISL